MKKLLGNLHDATFSSGNAFHDIISTLHKAEVTKRWLEIGLFLGISYGKLETLKTKSDDDKIRGVVTFWMNWNYDYETFGKPSWKSLVRAIGAQAGGNARRAAKKVAADHVVAPLAIGKHITYLQSSISSKWNRITSSHIHLYI